MEIPVNADPLHPVQWEPYWAQGDDAIRGHLPVYVLAQLYEAVKERLAFVQTIAGHEDPDGPYAADPVQCGGLVSDSDMYLCRDPIRVDLLPDIASMQGSLWMTEHTFDDRFYGYGGPSAWQYYTLDEVEYTPFRGTILEYINDRISALSNYLKLPIGTAYSGYGYIEYYSAADMGSSRYHTKYDHFIRYNPIGNKIRSVELKPYSDACYSIGGDMRTLSGDLSGSAFSVFAYDCTVEVFPGYDNGTKQCSMLSSLYDALNAMASRYYLKYNREKAALFHARPDLVLYGSTLQDVSCLTYEPIPPDTFRFHT